MRLSRSSSHRVWRRLHLARSVWERSRRNRARSRCACRTASRRRSRVRYSRSWSRESSMSIRPPTARCRYSFDEVAASVQGLQERKCQDYHISNACVTRDGPAPSMRFDASSVVSARIAAIRATISRTEGNKTTCAPKYRAYSRVECGPWGLWASATVLSSPKTTPPCCSP